MCKSQTLKEESASVPVKEEKYEKSRRLPLEFLDHTKHWVLVENGSFMGHFDQIPKYFRVGPWNIVCCVYLAALVYWILLNCVECYNNPPPQPEYSSYDIRTWQWWYNAAGFLWTLHIAAGVTKTELGWFAWISYTLQSWTMILARHGLSILAPFFPSLTVWNEALRFPMLVQTTVVFVIWNFAIMPSVYSQMKTEKRRRDFIKFCFSFLLSQLHIANLPLAAMNGVLGSPGRPLNKVDFCVALAFCLQYVLFYLFVLDRLGVHLYFIFSPRSLIALISWTVFVASYYAGFALWNTIILRYGGD